MAFPAVLGCQLQFTKGGAMPGPLQITEPPSTSVMIDNKPVYASPTYTILVTGYIGGPITIPGPTPIPVVIVAKQIMGVMIDNAIPLAMGDESTPTTFSGFKPGAVGPEPAVYVDSIMVLDAGQTSVDMT